jgi:TolA-binding protein
MKKIKAILATIIMLSAPCQGLFARRGFGAGFATGAITGTLITHAAHSSSTQGRHLRDDINRNVDNIRILEEEIRRLKNEIDDLRQEIRRLKR